MTGSLRSYVRRHEDAFREGAQSGSIAPIDMQAVRHASSMRQVADLVLTRSHGYRDCEAYLARGTTVHRIAARVSVPTLLLHAADDPVTPAANLPVGAAQRNRNVSVVVSAEGGHLGWATRSPRCTGWGIHWGWGGGGRCKSKIASITGEVCRGALHGGDGPLLAAEEGTHPSESSPVEEMPRTPPLDGITWGEAVMVDYLWRCATGDLGPFPIPGATAHGPEDRKDLRAMGLGVRHPSPGRAGGTSLGGLLSWLDASRGSTRELERSPVAMQCGR